MKKRILAIDAGTNSIGWAVVDRYEDDHYELVRYGVRIFQEGVKIEKGIESSKAAERTSHRALRRQYFRRRLRKIEVLKVLIRHGLCPALSEEDLKLWHSRKIYPAKPEFMQWQRTSEEVNPYSCRYTCLYNELDLTRQSDRYTLGRAMYHLAQRRGFLSNRLDVSEVSKDDGKVEKGIGELSEDMEAMGCRYLGEYFYRLYTEQGNKKRIRSRYTDREQHYRKEFDAICEKQNLPEDVRDELARALYFQRPLKSQRQSVGRCTFEKNKPRVSDSHYAYEEYRMLQFINSIRVRIADDLYDTEMRPLNEEEVSKIRELFFSKSRKSKPNFEFEDIAKKIAGKGRYTTEGSGEAKPYIFNYRMSRSVSGCPTTAHLRELFGDDWQSGIAETYVHNTRKDGMPKTKEEMADDVWNVLFSFDSEEKLHEFAKDKLQLDEESANKFVKIRLSRNYASLSLKAIRKILPFMRMGMLYSHAVFMANIPTLIGKERWEADKKYILDKVGHMIDAHEKRDGKLADVIKEWLSREYGVSAESLDNLYHPSMIKTYPDPKPNGDGVILLGSPQTNALRNPMAMRSLHQLRKVVNALILDGVIDHSTIVHIEYARELNNANQRAAISQRQRDLEKRHEQYRARLREFGIEATQTNVIKCHLWDEQKEICDVEPSQRNIIMSQLWEEQKGICLYTGKSIGIMDILGTNSQFDIEHTIPRSVGGDSTLENMTLCYSAYNRQVKKAQIPSQLSDYDAILERIKPWKKRIDELSKQIDRLSHGRSSDKDTNDKRIQKKNRLKMELDYWRGKCMRFEMTEVPEGFARRQGAGIGLVSKYAALYLNSYFKDIEHPERRQIYSVKGVTTSDFRKMWGIQEEDEVKLRDSHTHHCIDAIVIACIGKREYDAAARYYHSLEEYKAGRASKPHFPKPWPTFTEDLKRIADELLVVHDTKDNMPKKASRKIEVKGKGRVVAKGDCARGSLHNDTYYGAIERNGEVRYVVRRELSGLKEDDIKNIVDDAVREKVLQAVAEKGFKEAVNGKIWMNEEKQIPIRKVRCYATSVTSPLKIRLHRDQSEKEYKRQFHVTNEYNYCMAIYEGEVRGRKKREFRLVNMLEAARAFNDGESMKIAPEQYKGLLLKYVLRKGMQLLMLQQDECMMASNVISAKDISSRLYYITKLMKDGRIIVRHNAEARQEVDAATAKPFLVSDAVRPQISMSLSKFDYLVEGYDFELTPLGEVKFKK